MPRSRICRTFILIENFGIEMFWIRKLRGGVMLVWGDWMDCITLIGAEGCIAPRSIAMIRMLL
jgi:hypothetical protein